MPPSLYFKRPSSFGLTLYVVDDFFGQSPGNLSPRTPNCRSWLVFLLGWVCSIWGFKFFPSSPKNVWKGLGGLIPIPNGGEMFHCRTQEA